MSEDASLEDAARTFASRALGVPISHLVSTERIKHGLTNDSWRIRTVRDSVVVRLSNTAEAQLQIDRLSEARVLSIVAAAGMGPEVLLCEPENHVLVTRDAGATWNEGDARIAVNIKRVGALLARLHALDATPGVREVDLIATVSGYLDVLAARANSSQLTANATRTRAEHAALALSQNAFRCLCHNDVHSLNIVDDGALRLIDWEYAGIGEPMFDLASICVYHRYGRPDRERLLEAYLTAPMSNAAQQLELACWLFDYVKDLWMEVRGVEKSEILAQSTQSSPRGE